MSAAITANGLGNIGGWASRSDLRRIDNELEAHRRQVLAFVARRTRTLEDCEDVVQDVFIYAARKFKSRPKHVPLGKWLITIAASRIKNYYRDVTSRYLQRVS